MDDAPLDARLKIIDERVSPLLKSKSELFNKLAQTEEGGELLLRFVNDDSCMRIFFTAGAKDMAVTDKFPDEKMTKKKVAFCLKTAEVKFDEKKLDEMLNKLVIGDVSPSMLQNLHGVLRHVYLPLLRNPKNTVVCCSPRPRSAPPPSRHPPSHPSIPRSGASRRRAHTRSTRYMHARLVFLTAAPGLWLCRAGPSWRSSTS